MQFPDSLLPDSVQVIKLLEASSPHAKFFVLADTSYGSECVDEVAAEHLLADCIVHYGRATVVETTRLPVYFVFGQGPIDAADCLCKLTAFANVELKPEQEAVVFYECQYRHFIYSSLLDVSEQSLLPRTHVTKIVTSTTGGKHRDNAATATVTNENAASNASANAFRCYGRYLDAPLSELNNEKHVLVFVGGESAILLNLLLTYNEITLYRYDPLSKEFSVEKFNKNRLLQRRFLLVEKAKDARMIGIVIGTLVIDRYLEIIEYVKQMIRNAGKKFYVIVVGKLNVPKLSNFPDIDVFVLIAGPENSLIDSKDYFRPIITPFELEIALVRGKEWTRVYHTSYHHVLDSRTHLTISAEDEEQEEEEFRLSLVTGRMERNAKFAHANSASESRELAVRQDGQLQVYTAAHAFEGKSFKGLEAKIGETPVTNFIEGQTGIPFLGYTGEKSLRASTANEDSSGSLATSKEEKS